MSPQPLVPFKFLSFSFDFCSLHLLCLGVRVFFVLYLLVLVFSDVPGSRRNLVGISWLFGSSPPTLFQTFLMLYSFSSPSGMPLIHTLCLFCCCSVSHVWLFVTLRTAAHQAFLSFTISWSLLTLMSIELVMPSNHLVLCRPLHLLSAIFPSIRVFSNESALCIRWPKCWSFSFSISSSNEYSGLISFRID